MEDRTVTHSTFVLERTYQVTPERLYEALSNPEQKRRWYASEHGATSVEGFEMDFRVGGVERASYRFKTGTLFPGVELVHNGTFTDIVPNQRVVETSSMSLGGRPVSTSLITFEIVPGDGAAELVFTHQGAFFEGSDGPERRQEGWRKLLDNLGQYLSE